MLVEEKGDFFFPIFIVFIKKSIFEKKMIVLIILDLIDFFFSKSMIIMKYQSKIIFLLKTISKLLK